MWAYLWLFLFSFYISSGLPYFIRRLKEVESLNTVSPLSIFITEVRRWVEKFTQLTPNWFFKMWKLKHGHCRSSGSPCMMRHLSVSHHHRYQVGVWVGMGVPFMTGFIRVPQEEPPPAATHIHEVSIKTFRHGESWFDIHWKSFR